MQTISPSLRIGVLRGGPACAGRPSSEYEVSLKTGANILKTLSETHRPLDIFISKDGIWHMHGLPRKPEKIFPHVDVIWNGLHGFYGEDGTVQKLLDHHGVKYTGSKAFSSAISMNKKLSKEIFTKNNLKTPRYTVINRNDDINQKAKEIFHNFMMPVVVKPTKAGSSIGVSVVGNPSEIFDAIIFSFKHSDSVLVEEFIKGREATCAVIQDFRGQPIYALLPVEIKPNNSDFFDFNSKYTENGSSKICPGRFCESEKKQIEQYAKEAHRVLNLDHYSRSDFIVTPKRGIYILETNTLPSMTEESLLPKSLEAVGVSIRDFIHHILLLALNR